MLIECVLLSLIIGKLRGGKFNSLGLVSIKNPWMFMLAFAIEFGTLFAVSAGFETAHRFGIYLHALSYIVLFIALISNREYYAMWIVLIGSLLNFIVVYANGGVMPISVDGLARAGLMEEARIIMSGGIITHRALTASTRFPMFAEIIVLPRPYPFPRLMSIGDIAVSIGVALFIQSAMLQERMAKRSRMIRFKYKSKL